MRAVVCIAIGEPLQVVERETPEPGPNEVLIDVQACGLNYVDALMCAGGYQIKPELPFSPGSELAGVVSAVGTDTTGITPGTRVLSGGGYVSHAVRSADGVYAIPDGMTIGQAATVWQSYSTMRYAYGRAQLQKGETVLVLGAAGGIGRAAIDLGKALGATVIAAASSQERLATCKNADAAIDYSSEDLKTQARELTGGGGVDVVVDPVGGDLADSALRSLDYLGRYLVIGFAAGSIPKLAINQILLRNRNVVGIDWGAWSATHRDEQAALLNDVLAMAGRGEILPDEPKTYAFDDAQLALDDLMHRKMVGKAVLVP